MVQNYSVFNVHSLTIQTCFMAKSRFSFEKINKNIIFVIKITPSYAN